MSSFTASDLPIGKGERIYHLELKPGELSSNVLIVGDPERAKLIADEFFADIEVEHVHRGLRTITGTAKETGQRVSVTTSGMGVPSMEIVLNEIVALNEIDFKTRTRKKNWDPINIIRVGTSGGLQAETRLGTPIVTEFSVGLDNAGMFLCPEEKKDKECILLENFMKEKLDNAAREESWFKGKVIPYVAKADPDIVNALMSSAHELKVEIKKGITTTTPGFFAHQGRDIMRIHPTIPNIDGLLSSLNVPGINLKFENMEMESSFLLHFMGVHGYKAGTVCPTIANRREDTFAEDYEESIKNATRIALHALNQV